MVEVTPNEAISRAIDLVRRIAANQPWQQHYGYTWEQEAKDIVAALGDVGTDLAADVEALKAENKALRDEIDTLEQESCMAGDEAIKERDDLRARVAELEFRWAMIDQLRTNEGHGIEIVHDNPDPEGVNCAVRATRDFGVNYEIFYGDTLDDCFRAALKASKP